MAVEKWSDRVLVARLADDPQMTEDLLALDETPNHGPHDVVLDFSSVNYINSSHLARLLKLRKRMIADDGRLMLCSVGTQVWGAFLTTGLDKVFQFSDDMATALASIQLAR
ncbi:MAG TPA: STAS domain-containing protein [Humisphaera sp.]|nr:STAS domain-containing protein [Humisphaera sp.]